MDRSEGQPKTFHCQFSGGVQKGRNKPKIKAPPPIPRSLKDSNKQSRVLKVLSVLEVSVKTRFMFISKDHCSHHLCDKFRSRSRIERNKLMLELPQLYKSLRTFGILNVIEQLFKSVGSNFGF